MLAITWPSGTEVPLIVAVWLAGAALGKVLCKIPRLEEEMPGVPVNAANPAAVGAEVTEPSGRVMPSGIYSKLPKKKSLLGKIGILKEAPKRF